MGIARNLITRENYSTEMEIIIIYNWYTINVQQNLKYLIHKTKIHSPTNIKYDEITMTDAYDGNDWNLTKSYHKIVPVGL